MSLLQESIKVKMITSKGSILVNEKIPVGTDEYVLIKRTECKRCNTKFYPKMEFTGEIRDNKVCPFCKSPYWRHERSRHVPDKEAKPTKIKVFSKSHQLAAKILLQNQQQKQK